MCIALASPKSVMNANIGRFLVAINNAVPPLAATNKATKLVPVVVLVAIAITSMATNTVCPGGLPVNQSVNQLFDLLGANSGPANKQSMNSVL